MKWGRRVMGIARGRRRGRKFVNFAITAVLAFNRRGFVVRRGSVIVVVAWGLDVGSLIFLRVFFRRNSWM